MLTLRLILRLGSGVSPRRKAAFRFIKRRRCRSVTTRIPTRFAEGTPTRHETSHINFPCFVAAATSFGSRRAVAQEFSVGAYGSVDYEASRTVLRADNSPVNENGFSIPTLDLFLRGSLGNWSFLSEVLFDIDEGNTIGVDLDRFQVGYEVGDWLKITVGRFHTSLGYYNTAYPQGGAVTCCRWIDRRSSTSTTTRRSSASTGRPQLSRQAPNLAAAFELRPGRLQRPRNPADDLATAATPTTRRCSIFVCATRSMASSSAATRWSTGSRRASASTRRPITRYAAQQIFGAHIAYVEHPWHVIAEGYHISHIGPNQTQRTIAGLAELGYTIGQVTPYARYEFARFPSTTDVFWAPTLQQERGNYDAVSTGIKIVPNENFAVKIELSGTTARLIPNTALRLRWPLASDTGSEHVDEQSSSCAVDQVRRPS